MGKNRIKWTLSMQFNHDGQSLIYVHLVLGLPLRSNYTTLLRHRSKRAIADGNVAYPEQSLVPRLNSVTKLLQNLMALVSELETIGGGDSSHKLV